MMSRPGDPVVRNRDVKDALADAFTRAVCWAPAAMLRPLGGPRRLTASRTLAARVVEELKGDGWFERGRKMGEEHLTEAVAMGMQRAGAPILASLAAASQCDCACDGEVLDKLGAHLGEAVWKELRRRDLAIEQRS